MLVRMALPTAYLTSFKNVGAILTAIQAAQAPPRFTQKFLETLGFPNTNDRTMINVLKALGFLTDTGAPTARYHQYLDQTQSAVVLARAIREAYADLFQINTQAHKMTSNEVKNKMKTLSAGQYTDRVLQQMAGTFTYLCQEADFAGVTTGTAVEAVVSDEPTVTYEPVAPRPTLEYMTPPRFGGLVYNINVVLPESKDQAVYDAIFKSLKEHLT
jgi:hypothetical protein